MILQLSKETLKALVPSKEDNKRGWDRWLVTPYGDRPDEPINGARVVAGAPIWPINEIAAVGPAGWLHVNGVTELDFMIPDYARLLIGVSGRSETLPAGSFEAAFQTDYFDAFNFVREKGQTSRIRLLPRSGDGQAWTILNPTYPEFIGLIMPYRDSSEIPAWVKALSTEGT